MMTFTSVPRYDTSYLQNGLPTAAALCKNERNARVTASATLRRLYEHAISGRARATFLRRIAVSFADSRAIGIDGIASFEDVANFFARLPNPDKQFIVMPGIAHTSTRSKNWALVYHLLDAYFSQPAPVYVG